MKTSSHTKKNLEVFQYEPLKYEEFWDVLKPVHREQHPEETIDLE